MPELFVIHKLIAILHFLTLQAQHFSSLISTLLCTLSYILYTVCQTFGVLTSTRPPVPCFPSERDCSVLLNSPSSVADNKLHILTVQWMFGGAYTQDSQVYILYDEYTLLVGKSQCEITFIDMTVKSLHPVIRITIMITIMIIIMIII